MGSSCFARGNAENLSFLENYIKENNINADIELAGCRCEDCCCQGPNVTINGKRYSKVTVAKIKRFLDKNKDKVK